MNFYQKAAIFGLGITIGFVLVQAIWCVVKEVLL